MLGNGQDQPQARILVCLERRTRRHLQHFLAVTQIH